MEMGSLLSVDTDAKGGVIGLFQGVTGGITSIWKGIEGLSKGLRYTLYGGLIFGALFLTVKLFHSIGS